MSAHKKHVGLQGGNMLDCAIIGVGPAGLVVARDLRNWELNVVVPEARDRVGGRVENGVLVDGQYVELGGQWIGTGHNAIFELTECYGLRTVGTPVRGNLVAYARDRLLEVPPVEDGEELTPLGVTDLNQGLLRSRRLAHRLADDPVWVAADGAWSWQDLRHWMRTNLQTGGIQTRFGEVYEVAPGPMIPQVTLQEGLQQINLGLGLETMTANNGELNQQYANGGVATLCDVLVADLGDVARLRGVVIKTAHNETAAATLVLGGTIETCTAVLTLPPCPVVALEYDPPLPQWRQGVMEKVTPGNVIKAYLAYEMPFWREQGLSGQSDSDEGAVRVTSGTTPVDSTHGLLMGFFKDSEADSLARRPLEARRRTFAKSVVRVSGVEASEPVEYLKRDWSAEQYTRGCHGVHFVPGIQISDGPVLAAPDGCLYRARAEYSARSNGCMEGVACFGEKITVIITAALI